jgi:alpha-acetolactate decarboxylase
VQAPLTLITAFLRLASSSTFGRSAQGCDGHFKRVRTRAVNPSQPGTRLVDAAKSQSVFNFRDIEGTLIGRDRRRRGDPSYD